MGPIRPLLPGPYTPMMSNWKYRALLLALLLLILAYPTVRLALPSRDAFDALAGLVFLAITFVVYERKRFRLLALCLGLPAVLATWGGRALPGLHAVTAAITAHLISAMFLAFTVAFIVTSIYADHEITVDGICGTLSGYLIVGLVFSHAYCIIELTAPGSFLINDQKLDALHDNSRTHFQLTYFSLITMTTVGYGDIKPISEAARGFAVVQAVIGQFYIAVLIADLIGKRVTQQQAR